MPLPQFNQKRKQRHNVELECQLKAKKRPRLQLRPIENVVRIRSSISTAYTILSISHIGGPEVRSLYASTVHIHSSRSCMGNCLILKVDFGRKNQLTYSLSR